MRRPHVLIAALLIALASPVFAAWSESGIVFGGTMYSRLASVMSVVADGRQGAIAYTGHRFTATRVDPEGVVLWSVNPFAAANLPEPTLNQQIGYAIAGDGGGGVWCATDDSSRNVVAVHYGASGALQRGVVLLRENPGEHWVLAAVSDAGGGVFVVWSDNPTTQVDLRATHVDALGNVTGPANIFGNPDARAFGGAVPDGVGGLIVMSPGADGATLQRLDATLTPKYGAGGRVDAPAAFRGFSLAASGDGGAFVAWADGPGAAASLRLQRLDANGLVTLGWPAEGAVAALPPRDPSRVKVVADGKGGACISWIDRHVERGSIVAEVRASRVLANGRIATGWQPAGAVVVEGEQDDLYFSRSLNVVADETGGCYLEWETNFVYEGDTYAQHLAADGGIFPGWPVGGLKLGVPEFAGGDESDRSYAISDDAGGVYVVWDEFTYPMRDHQARLTRLLPGGVSGDGRAPTSSLSLARVSPNPASGRFTLSATLPDDRPARLEVFDLAGRISYAREVQGAGEQGLTLDGASLAPGVHWMRLTHATGVRMARIVVLR